MEKKEYSMIKLIDDLEKYIDISFQDGDFTINDLVVETNNKIEAKCWEANDCSNFDCPAYGNDCRRCWLIAGTMCDETTRGTFAGKIDSCFKCNFYQGVVVDDDTVKLRELIIILINSLRNKQVALREALSSVKALSGLIPICASCKKIRDDKGYWKQLEEYMSLYSDAKFSHSICPKCLSKHYPEMLKK